MVEIKSANNIRYIFGVFIPIREIDPMKLAGYILNGKAEGEYPEYQSILDGKPSSKAKADAAKLYHVIGYNDIIDLHEILVADDNIVLSVVETYRKPGESARVVDLVNTDDNMFHVYSQRVRYAVGIDMPNKPWETTVLSEEAAVSQIIDLARRLAYDKAEIMKPEPIFIMDKYN